MNNYIHFPANAITGDVVKHDGVAWRKEPTGQWSKINDRFQYLRASIGMTHQPLVLVVLRNKRIPVAQTFTIVVNSFKATNVATVNFI